MLDSIKIYGKTKEQFGWPEDPPEDFSSASVNNVCSPSLNQGNGTADGDIATPTTTGGTVLERYGPFHFSIHNATSQPTLVQFVQKCVTIFFLTRLIIWNCFLYTVMFLHCC